METALSAADLMGAKVKLRVQTPPRRPIDHDAAAQRILSGEEGTLFRHLDAI